MHLTGQYFAPGGFFFRQRLFDVIVHIVIAVGAHALAGRARAFTAIGFDTNAVFQRRYIDRVALVGLNAGRAAILEDESYLMLAHLQLAVRHKKRFDRFAVFNQFKSPDRV